MHVLVDQLPAGLDVNEQVATLLDVETIADALQQLAEPVPLQIRNAPTRLMADLGYGDGYQYAHDYEGNFAQQEYLPAGLEGSRFYEPCNTPRENETRRTLHEHWGGKYGY